MKKLVNLVLTLAALGGLAYVLWLGVHKQQDKATSAPALENAAGAEEAKPEEYVVKLEKKQARALAIEKDQPQKIEFQPKKRAFGIVLDPAPLVTLDGELATAESALVASKADHERSQALVQTNDTSRKNAETATAQYLADQVKVQNLIRSAQFQWGALFSPDAAQRHIFTDNLVAGKLALVRVDLLPDDVLPQMPSSAELHLIGHESQTLRTDNFVPATTTDPKTQAQGLILLVEQSPFPLRPGMALTAWLQLPDKPQQGYAVPASAILRHDGRTWVYVQEEEEKFVRKPVTLGAPLADDHGWFIPEGGGLTAEDVMVVVGASSMLSEEFKAQGGGGD